MKRLFLDPRQPLATCSAPDCLGCPLPGKLHWHFNGLDLLRFMLMVFPAGIVGGLGIARINDWWLIPWIGLALSYFGLVEIRVMCSHCPHYAEPGTRTLQCWANYGVPKLWRYRPGPMTGNETLVFYAGMILVLAYPLAFIVAGAEWLLLGLFAISVAGLAFLMARLMCARCINFACPFNRVNRELRQAFFARNPGIAQAWQADEAD